jgi:tetratricopeptide (TPR) repeat protein
MADRYSYMPFTGLFIIIAWGVPELSWRLPYRKIVLALAAAVLASAMMVRTWVQTGHWQNSYTLYSHAIAVTENNSNMNYNLAVTLYDQERLEEAIMHYREALRIEPQNLKTRINLGMALFERGQYDEALEHFNMTVRLDPDSQEGHYNLGSALLLQGRLDEAAEQFQEAIRIKVEPKTLNKLGSVYLKQGRADEAIIHYEYSVELKPDQPQVHRDLGFIFHQEDNFERVIYHWEKALELNPDNIELINNLAWIIATHSNAAFRNPEKAIRLAEKACELSSYEIAGSLDTLSAAYAAAGRFPEAIAAAEKALKLVQSREQAKLAEEIRKHLSLYKAGKPYVEP